MLAAIAAELDTWIVERNVECWNEGMSPFRACRIAVLGQTALLEARAPLHLNVTNDVDVYADYEPEVQQQFERLLRARGLELDPVGSEVWMPRQTLYSDLFAGRFVTMQLADVDAVLLSKCLKAPERNRALIVEYLAAGPSDRFLSMAKRHRLDLEQFL